MARRPPAWFGKARFGQFIHWGPFTLHERGEQVLYREHMPPSEYRRLAQRFRAAKLDVDAWIGPARHVGMRYAILTSKNHDGFALWDSQVSEFTAVKIGPRRDVVREFLQACRRHGLKAGLYFSLADWMQPGYFAGAKGDRKTFKTYVDYTHAQVRELCTRYGKLDVLWFDGVWPYTAADWRAPQLLSMVRRFQPQCIVNNRMGLPGDFVTPEQHIPEQQFKPTERWESCLTSTESSWGHHAGVRFKSARQVIHELCSVAQLDGNLLFNVGPKADGTLPRPYVQLMAKVAAWLKINGRAVFDTGESICETHTFGLMTVGARCIYLHVLAWPGRQLVLAGLANKVLGVRFLDGGKRLPFQQTRHHLTIHGLPPKAPDPCNTVIVVDVKGSPRAQPWARERIWTGALEPTMHHAKQVLARMQPWSKR